MPESAPPSSCRVCRSPGVCACVACGGSSCADTSHLYDVFLTHRYGTKADEIGSKFAYLCMSCGGVVCVPCLGLRNGYPCDESEVEHHPFSCPRCRGPISVLRFDNQGYWAAAEAMLKALEAVTATSPEARAPGTIIPYGGYDPVRSFEPRSIHASPFGPHPATLLPGDAWKSVVRFTTEGGQVHELTLLRLEHPVFRTDLYVTTPAGPVYVGSLEPDRVYYDDRLVRLAGMAAGSGPTVSISLHGPGMFVANLSSSHPIEVERVGIVRGVRPPPFRSLSEIAERPRLPADEEGAQRLKGFGEILTELTNRHIWDYMWLEAPPPGKFGKKALLTLAGSTDLIYYHLVRVVFKGVLYNTTRPYFSHPEFRLAPPAAARQLMDLVPFGARSKALCISRDFGGNLEETGFVVADFVFVIDTDLDKPYRPSKRAHEDWWH